LLRKANANSIAGRVQTLGEIFFDGSVSNVPNVAWQKMTVSTRHLFSLEPHSQRQ